jgi:hypothetical protein
MDDSLDFYNNHPYIYPFSPKEFLETGVWKYFQKVHF